MAFPYEEFDLSDVRTYSLDSRSSKARIEDFGRPVRGGATFKEWFDALPAILGAQDVRRVATEHEARCSAILNELQSLSAWMGALPMSREPFTAMTEEPDLP